MEKENLLRHLAIIMDGNGRWAKKRNKKVGFGHKAGAEVLMRMAKHIKELGVKELTVYAFSTENWNRPKDEVDYLMELLKSYIKNQVSEFAKDKTRVKFLGNFDKLDAELIKLINETEDKSKEFSEYSLNICLSYGGRQEIIDSIKLLQKDIFENKIKIDDLDQNVFRRYMYNPEMSDPDLIIRTGGVMRVSNFLLWQIAYSEFYSTDILWPDFTEKDLDEAIQSFKMRKRNYGKREN